MSYAITYSRAYVGVEAPLVSVETHLSGGLPALTIVGLPETAVQVGPQLVPFGERSQRHVLPAAGVAVYEVQAVGMEHEEPAVD